MDEATSSDASALSETVVQALPVYPWPVSADRIERIKEAKATIPDAPLVKLIEAKPGSGRILTYTPPPFVAEYCLVTEETSLENLALAIGCVLGLREDLRLVSYEKALSRLVGREVREVTDV